MSLRTPLVTLLWLAALAATAAGATGPTNADRARALYDSAQRRLAAATPEQRQFALRELEDASHLLPDDPEIAVALGRLYLDSDMLQRAFAVADRLVRTDSSDARVLLLHGLAWRRRWLAESDPDARDRAILDLARAGRHAPREYGCWAALMPLLVDAGELELAEMVAHLAARAAPGNPEATLLVATASQLRGDLESAETLFQAALPALRPSLRECLRDLTPLLPPPQVRPYRNLRGEARARFEASYWKRNDPDVVSVLNEARIEFWSRVTLACALYGEPRGDLWDLRAEYYVRFGRPALARLNPGDQWPRQGDWLAWAYPDLGMQVWMGSPSAFVGFRNVFTSARGWPRPAPESLATHDELQETPGAWAVFRRLPAGVERIDARFASAHFESDRGPQLLAKTEVLGGPEDRFTAEWVVFDSSLAEVHRDVAAFTVSACDPGEIQSAALALPLDPGTYRIGLRVTNPDGRRAVLRRDVQVPVPEPGLALSDLVLTCGDPSTSVVPGQGVRLDLDTGIEPAAGDHLEAYFEIYRLDADAGGAGRFEYECRVRSAERDRRGWLSRTVAPRFLPTTLTMSRSEVTQGPVRRQFLSIPVRDLPAGPYRLEVCVRDTVSGEEAICATRFTRATATPPADPPPSSATSR